MVSGPAAPRRPLTPTSPRLTPAVYVLVVWTSGLDEWFGRVVWTSGLDEWFGEF